MSTSGFKTDPESTFGISTPRGPEEDAPCREHVTTQRAPRFSCSTCTKSYSSLQHLRFHELQRCDGLNQTTCERCKIEFASIELLEWHSTFDTCATKLGGGGYSTRGLAKEWVVVNSSGIMCPVATCRRWFGSEMSRRIHVVKSHAAWGNGCLICAEKFAGYEELLDHLGRAHGSDVDVVRVKTELILDEGGETGAESIAKIKEEID
ncbi:protein snail homolog Sna isoform X2 [Folsomia candida]|uniref:protein snail homolog Sna isoform X2 n=1 Tax=Folsomia candida TaxID=158441 RepID=UPI000B8F866F|nr:protein snail homolog Sna isoform X2 [Folsomia candida]XP_035715628.1 protein snail homolog Sna isoform X2 [Folsomia candida]XP_035715629.1 protein snail homolog Sna isoform X2 [Folsomia candida]